jgi:competence protein ComEA
MRKWLNNYFDFSKAEFNGLLILFILIIVVTLMPLTFIWFRPQVGGAIEGQAEIKKLAWMENMHKSTGIAGSRAKSVKADAVLSEFDPNRLDVKRWQTLGLSLKQAQSVMNYVNKGGQFFKKEDVKKMYTINAALYARLEPFIKISPTELAEHRLTYTKRPVKELQVFDINTADTLQLQEIRGVGPAFARRIAMYRARLGGFYKLSQLLEVYGLDSLKFEEIKGQLRLGITELRQININTAAFEDLKNHPYLKYKQANAIIQYRKQHGKYSSFADLKKVAILPAETLDNLAPYFSY